MSIMATSTFINWDIKSGYCRLVSLKHSSWRTRMTLWMPVLYGWQCNNQAEQLQLKQKSNNPYLYCINHVDNW
jgi:hypothetical protein